MLSNIYLIKYKSGFEATYAWELHHIFNAMAKGGSETKNMAGDGTIKTDAKGVKDLKEYMERDDVKYPAPAMRLMFTSNHDENSWAGTEFERMGDAHKALAAGEGVAPVKFVEGVGENVLAFTRTKEDNTVLCLFNFSAEPTTVTLTEAEAGDYECACGEKRSFKTGDVVELAAWGFMLLAK